jgi:hypothetical protein
MAIIIPGLGFLGLQSHHEDSGITCDPTTEDPGVYLTVIQKFAGLQFRIILGIDFQLLVGDL